MALPEYTRRRVAQDIETLLQRAGVAGVVPTPLDVVAQAAGIGEVLDISDLPPALLAKKPSFLRRVVGALVYREEIAFVDRSAGAARGRFIEAHEISHRALRWHQGSHELHLDDDGHIDRRTEKELEAEANHGAAQLLFQGVRFNQAALDYEVSLAAPIALASHWGTSIHAATWHYVEYHPDPVALLMTGPDLSPRGAVRIFQCLASPPFVTRYGSIETWFPTKSLRVTGEGPVEPLGQLTRRALDREHLPSLDLVQSVGDSTARFTAEAFYNGWCVFIFIRPKARIITLGRRIRLAAG